MDANTEYTEETVARHKPLCSDSSNMLELALLLQQCDTTGGNTKELVSFIQDTNKETGEITTLKIVL